VELAFKVQQKNTQQMVVVVARKDLGKRLQSNIDFKIPYGDKPLNTLKRKIALNYYQK
jgi:hypothetical protein